MGCSKGSSEGEVYSNTTLTQGARKTSYRKPNFILKTTQKRRWEKKLVKGKKSYRSEQK